MRHWSWLLCLLNTTHYNCSEIIILYYIDSTFRWFKSISYHIFHSNLGHLKSLKYSQGKKCQKVHCKIYLCTCNCHQNLIAILYIFLSNLKNDIGGVMVSVLALNAVDCGFEPRSRQTKDYIQWNLCVPTPEISVILWLPTRNSGPKIFL